MIDYKTNRMSDVARQLIIDKTFNFVRNAGTCSFAVQFMDLFILRINS